MDAGEKLVKRFIHVEKLTTATATNGGTQGPIVILDPGMEDR
jgi:hypothetical protein